VEKKKNSNNLVIGGYAIGKKEEGGIK